jgi:SAM-dependent methyltransferase
MPSGRDAFDDLGRTIRFYDEYGVKEWLRLEADARQRVILHVHNAILRRFLQPGDRVLDAGCGAGRFSAELANLGAKVTAGDISRVQVDLAQNIAGHDSLAPVQLAQLSVTELPFRDAAFDGVVCYGSVLSHLGDQAEEGAAELARVTRPGGLILLSVQSAHNYYLPYILQRVGTLGLRVVDEAIMSGTELHDVTSVPWRQFSQAQVESLAHAMGCEPVLISASNVLATISDIPLLEKIEKDASLWPAFLRWEEHLAQQPGNRDRGAFTIGVLRRL